MAITPNTRVCTHIKVNGIRCGSPALRQEVFCYFHQRMIRGVRTPPKSRLHPIAMLEDPQAIQASIMEVVNAIVRNQIDIERARLVLRALGIAVRNAGKARFDCWTSDMVKNVPDYPAAQPATASFAISAAQPPAVASAPAPQPQRPEPARPVAAAKAASANGHGKPPTSVKAAMHARSATPSPAG